MGKHQEFEYKRRPIWIETQLRLSSLPLVHVAEVKSLFDIGHFVHFAQRSRRRNWLTPPMVHVA